MAKFKRKTKEERQKEIQEAAKGIFLSKGFRCTTMEDIVKATSLSKGGVYQYYKSTKAILFDLMQSGNAFRYERNESIIHAFPQNKDTAELLTEIAMAKIFDRNPSKRLYLMFLAEILYDKDYETLFFQLEKQSLMLFIKNLHLPVEKEEELFNLLKEKILFFFRILNGILIMDELFKEDVTFSKNREKIEAWVYRLVCDFLELLPPSFDLFKAEKSLSAGVDPLQKGN